METQTLETANIVLPDLRSISEFYITHRCSDVVRKLEDFETANLVLADLRSISEFYRTHRCSYVMRKLEDFNSIQTQTLDQYRQLIHDCSSLSSELLREIKTIMEDPKNLIPVPLSGTDLPEEENKITSDACQRVQALILPCQKLTEFANRGMTLFSPNLSALVGSEVAARLLSAAGGLERLSSMSIPNLLLFGAENAEICYVERSGLFGSIPSRWRRQARKLVAHKAILAAKADCGGANAGGGIGRRFAKEVSVVIGRWEKSSKSSLEDLIGSSEEVGVNNNDNIGLRNSHIDMLSVARDDAKFKLKKERSRRVVSRAMEESLALALGGIEIADVEKEKDSGSGKL